MMSTPLFIALLIAGLCLLYYVEKIFYYRKMRQEIQSQATVKQIFKDSFLVSQPKILIEYKDQQNVIHQQKLRPFGLRSYKLGENIDIAYKASNPAVMVVWNGQEAVYLKMFIWGLVGTIAFIVSLPFMEEKRAIEYSSLPISSNR